MGEVLRSKEEDLWTIEGLRNRVETLEGEVTRLRIQVPDVKVESESPRLLGGPLEMSPPGLGPRGTLDFSEEELAGVEEVARDWLQLMENEGKDEGWDIGSSTDEW